MAARIYVDSNVFIYAVDGAEELKARSKQTLERYIGEGHQLHSSELTLGECLRGVGRRNAGTAKTFLQMLEDEAFVHLTAVSREIIVRAAALGADLNMKLVDAIHVATAEALGCTLFLTNDRGIRLPTGIDIEQP